LVVVHEPSRSRKQWANAPAASMNHLVVLAQLQRSQPAGFAMGHTRYYAQGALPPRCTAHCNPHHAVSCSLLGGQVASTGGEFEQHRPTFDTVVAALASAGKPSSSTESPGVAAVPGTAGPRVDAAAMKLSVSTTRSTSACTLVHPSKEAGGALDDSQLTGQLVTYSQPEDLDSADEVLSWRSQRVAANSRPAAGGIHDLVEYGAPRPHNEESRLATVQALGHMALTACPHINSLLEVICSVWQAPTASVTMLDSDHVWMCNAQGGAAPGHKPWAGDTSLLPSCPVD
jgi:hypothetical protein